MSLLSLFQNHGRYNKVSSSKGGEYHGPCPKCGGNDRFIVWPERNSFWCRQCEWNGDDIEALRVLESLSCKEAFARVGRECGKEDCVVREKCTGTPQPHREHATTATVPAVPATENRPAVADSPADIWRGKAEKLVAYAHDQLLASAEKLEYLSGRGLDHDAVVKYHLGILPQDNYRDRSSWGLPVEIKENGKPKKLWLPKGIVIPFFFGAHLHRVRIRRDEVIGDSSRYYWVPGSGNDVVVLSPGHQVAVIVESDLDGLLVDHLAGDMASTIPLGTSSAKPKEAAVRALDEAVVILVALDADEAGLKAWKWWRENYHQKAVRWPVPVGKDPGEAYQQGVDIRAWILAGLPVSLQPKQVKVETEAVKTETKPGKAEITEAAPTVEPLVHVVTAKDGRTIHITNDQAEYARLVAEGKIVFDGKELALIKNSGATPEQAASFLNIKQTFPGARIDNVEGLEPEPAEPEVVREPGTCYWSKTKEE
ncbi:MAG: alpha helicase [Geobacter sp.]|nr:MAG: alpha helicase [Geobacter sp.]